MPAHKCVCVCVCVAGGPCFKEPDLTQSTRAAAAQLTSFLQRRQHVALPPPVLPLADQVNAQQAV